MRLYTDQTSVRTAARNPALDRHLRAILRLRLSQTVGGGAHFHVVEVADGPAEAEAAVGFPLTIDGEPCWEWAQRHPGGWVEIVFVLSDDGPAQVLIVPDGSPVAELVCATEVQAADD